VAGLLNGAITENACAEDGRDMEIIIKRDFVFQNLSDFFDFYFLPGTLSIYFYVPRRNIYTFTAYL
jgi:hypothetical protein